MKPSAAGRHGAAEEHAEFETLLLELSSRFVNLPVEAATDRERARQSGIQSSLCLPLLAGHDEPVGALALNTLRAERDWPDATVK
jgi:GAF domain-containing protein